MKIAYRIAPDAKPLIDDLIGEDYTRDGVIDDDELMRLPDLRESLRIAGVESGGEISDNHSKMLVSQALTLGAGFAQQGKMFSLSSLANASAGYRARAREATATGNYDDAIKAVATAIAIDQRWLKVDLEKRGPRSPMT